MLGLGLRRAVGVGLGFSLVSLRSTVSAEVKFTHCDNINVINPLKKQDKLPLFNQITSEHVLPALEDDLEKLRTGFKSFEATLSKDKADFGVVESMEKLNYPFGYSWSVVKHLLAVRNNDSLRKAHDAIQPRAVSLRQEIGQSKAMYDALSALTADPVRWNQLDEAQKRIITSSLKQMKHSGVGLPESEREKFNKNAQELAVLKTNFQNNLLDATKEIKFLITDRSKVDGLPASALGLAAQQAANAGHAGATPENGPWLLTMDLPSYLPAMQHIRDRSQREQLYRAYVSRASTGATDNTGNILRILQLQLEQSRMLGYQNYAEQSLASKMAPSVAKVSELVEMLREVAYPAAQKDIEEIRTFAKSEGCAYADDLSLWDIPFWSERLREKKYDYKEEDVRPYFTLPAVLDGLFSLSTRLFGIKIEPADGETEVWNSDVRFFKIRDVVSGEHIASFFLDPYSRPSEKRGGAWMDVCQQRSTVMNHKPVAYLVCNGSPPVGDKPALLSFREVETLFHEFGHGLQHMLTTVPHHGAAGINNVEWDAVELPSQFMENWCYDRPTLFGMAKHFATGEALPEELFQKIKAAKTFQAGLQMLRQLYFGRIDMDLYSTFDPNGKETVFDAQRKLYGRYTVILPLPEDRFLCSFSHIFGGGYAAGYYSYKWAEVMSADAFAAFEENDLSNEAAVQRTGRLFRNTVLSMGGGKHPTEVFKEFRGREPSPAALLRHNGLAKE